MVEIGKVGARIRAIRWTRATSGSESIMGENQKVLNISQQRHNGITGETHKLERRDWPSCRSLHPVVAGLFLSSRNYSAVEDVRTRVSMALSDGRDPPRSTRSRSWSTLFACSGNTTAGSSA